MKHSTFTLEFMLLAKCLKQNKLGNIQSIQTRLHPKHVTRDSMVTENSLVENEAGWEGSAWSTSDGREELIR